MRVSEVATDKRVLVHRPRARLAGPPAPRGAAAHPTRGRRCRSPRSCASRSRSSTTGSSGPTRSSRSPSPRTAWRSATASGPGNSGTASGRGRSPACSRASLRGGRPRRSAQRARPHDGGARAVRARGRRGGRGDDGARVADRREHRLADRREPEPGLPDAARARRPHVRGEHLRTVARRRGGAGRDPRRAHAPRRHRRRTRRVRGRDPPAERDRAPRPGRGARRVADLAAVAGVRVRRRGGGARPPRPRLGDVGRTVRVDDALRRVQPRTRFGVRHVVMALLRRHVAERQRRARRPRRRRARRRRARRAPGLVAIVVVYLVAHSIVGAQGAPVPPPDRPDRARRRARSGWR